MAWTERDSLRFSQAATESRDARILWAWVANCYRLRGYDDDRCIAEATRTINAYLDQMEFNRQYTEGLPRRKRGPRRSTPAIASKFRARAVARRLRRGPR